MNLPFGKKKKAGEAGGSSGRRPAGERVEALSSQGLSEPEVIRALRAEGYTPMEVDNAMKQALRGAVDSQQQPVPQQYGPPQSYPGAPELAAPPPPPTYADRRRIFPEEASAPLPPQGAGQPMPPFSMEEMQRIERNKPTQLPELPGLPGLGEPDMGAPFPEDTFADEFKIPGLGEDMPPQERPGAPGAQRQRPRFEGRRQLEEMAEAIVDEKAELFRSEVDQVSEEMKKLNAKIQVLEERFNQIDDKKKSELDEIKGSIATYRQSMSDVSARMEAVERAMKDSMTPMMQTLRSLSDAVRAIKSK